MEPTKEALQLLLVDAALSLAEATGTHAFSIPVPNTMPQLWISLHEGPVTNALAVAANDPDAGK